MRHASKLLSVIAAFAFAASGPAIAFARGPIRRPVAPLHDVSHAPGIPRDVVRRGKAFGFDTHRRRRVGLLYLWPGAYGVPYPEPDESAAPDALAAVPPEPSVPPPAATPVAPAPAGPPAYVYAQIGLPDFAPRIIYRHPVKRRPRHLVVVYGTHQVDRQY